MLVLSFIIISTAFPVLAIGDRIVNEEAVMDLIVQYLSVGYKNKKI
jgi:hypothetical protein